MNLLEKLIDKIKVYKFLEYGIRRDGCTITVLSVVGGSA